MSEQIKECPYCESKNCEVDDMSYGLDYYGECNDCGARGPLAKSKTDAVQLWNAAANQIEQLRNQIDDLLISAGALIDERHRLYKERDEAIDEKLRWHKIAMESLNERDEARAWARRLLALVKKWQCKYKEMEFANQTIRFLVGAQNLDNLNNLLTFEKCTCGTTAICPIHGPFINGSPYWCDTTNKAQP